VRIIAGKFKGRSLFSPKGTKITRPTTDRVKETLFSILFSKDFFTGNCQNPVALDLFCGSGALGIEALSRGASEAVFVDSSRSSVALCKKNLGVIDTKAKVFCSDFSKALKAIATSENSKKFDIIFLDPPYKEGLESKAIAKIIELELLNEGGIIVVEHDVKNALETIVANINNFNEYFDVDSRIIGETVLSFLTIFNKEQN